MLKIIFRSEWAKRFELPGESRSPLPLLLCAALLLNGCQAALTPMPLPTPAVLTVQATPALQTLGEPFRACANELGNTGLVLLDTPADSIDLNRSALALRWGASGTSKGYAAVVGQEDLAIIVNPQNTNKSISLADLQAIYTGALRNWSQSQSTQQSEIQPWVYLDGDDAQAVFDTGILNGQPASRRVISLAPDPAAMREAVASSPAAIGFLPRRWLDPTVKVLPVEGLAPDRLRQPILALSASEPQGIEKSWLICLQERLSE